MGFRTIAISSHSKLTYKNNHLVYKSAERMEMIHLSEVDVFYGLCEEGNRLFAWGKGRGSCVSGG